MAEFSTTVWVAMAVVAGAMTIGVLHTLAAAVRAATLSHDAHCVLLNRRIALLREMQSMDAGDVVLATPVDEIEGDEADAAVEHAEPAARIAA